MRKTLLAIGFCLIHLLAAAQYFPPDFPNISIQRPSGATLCDYLFLSSVRFQLPSPKQPVSMILDRQGDLVWFHQGTENMFDFEAHPAGYISFFSDSAYHLLDSSFDDVGQIECVGRETDFHELTITSNGRIFTLCHDDSTMDLSSMTTTGGLQGSPNANVRVQTVQELSFGGNLVKEWEPWPWYTLQDADSFFFSSPTEFELTHTNSIDLGANEQMLLSHRSLHEVTLLDWQTGQIIGRLGGKNSDFAMANSAYFTGQHDARFITGSRISLYDNGAQSDPVLARGMVFDLDTANWSATVAAQFLQHNLISSSMGSMQMLPDGRALLNHGRFSPNILPNIEFYDPAGNLLANITLESTYFTYRATCYELPWQIQRPRILCQDQGGSLLLSTEIPANLYGWSTGESSATISVSDTGRYQVFVPGGIGFVGSEVLEITNVAAGCPVVGLPEQMLSRPRPAKPVGSFDLLGRPVEGNPQGQLLIERFQDGSARKRVRF